MKKHFKEFISIMLSLMLVFSSTLVVFAEEDNEAVETTEQVVEEKVEEEKPSEEVIADEEDDTPKEEPKEEEGTQDPIEEPQEETVVDPTDEEIIEDKTSEEDVVEEEEVTEEEIIEVEDNFKSFIDPDLYWNLYREADGQHIYISDEDIYNGNDIVFYYNAAGTECNKDNMVAYFSGYDNTGEDYTLTFFKDICLNSIYFGDHEETFYNYVSNITIDLNGHDVHIGPDTSSNPDKWSALSVYCNYNLQIIDSNNYKTGSLSNRYDSGYPVLPFYVISTLTIDGAKLTLYDTNSPSFDEYPGIINADNLIVKSGSINIDCVTDASSKTKVKAGIYTSGDLIVWGGSIKCTYTIGTAAIYTEGNYFQKDGSVDLFMDSSIEPHGEKHFACGVAAGNVFDSEHYGSGDNFMIIGGYLNICMGTNHCESMRNTGIVSEGNIVFRGNSHIKINSLGGGSLKDSNVNEISTQIIYCVETLAGDICLEDFVDVKCSIGNVYNVTDAENLMASNGNIYITGNALFAGDIGDTTSSEFIVNIYAYNYLSISDNSIVNVKIGDSENSANIFNLWSCANNNDSYLIIDGQAKVNASLGEVVNSTYANNIRSENGPLVIVDSPTVNANAGNIYNAENSFSNICASNSIIYIGSKSETTYMDLSSYGVEEYSACGKPTVNTYINEVINNVFFNLYANNNIGVSGANVNAKVGKVFNAGGCNIHSSNDSSIYVTDDSNVSVSVGDVYLTENTNSSLQKTMGFGVRGLYAENEINFLDNSSTTISIGDIYLGPHFISSNSADVLNSYYYGVFTDCIGVEDNATLSVNGGYGASLLSAYFIYLGGGNTYLNAASYATPKPGESLIYYSALIESRYYDDKDSPVFVHGGNLYGYNMVPEEGYGVVYYGTGEHACYFEVTKDSEVVLDVLSYGKGPIETNGEDISVGSHLFYGNRAIAIESEYIYGSPSITGLYGTYSNNLELVDECRYIMFSYRPYIIPDFDDDDDSGSDSKHVVPNTGVYY